MQNASPARLALRDGDDGAERRSSITSADLPATPSPTTAPRRLTPLEVLTERAAARAYLWSTGEFDLQEAVDMLQQFAERCHLVEQVGQDHIQAVINAAFAPYRREAEHE